MRFRIPVSGKVLAKLLTAIGGLLFIESLSIVSTGIVVWERGAAWWVLCRRELRMGLFYFADFEPEPLSKRLRFSIIKEKALPKERKGRNGLYETAGKETALGPA